MHKRSTLLDITVTALFSALLVGGKWALAVLPNIEVITLLLALFASVWGIRCALLSANVFVVLEAVLWGIAPWVITYLIYWNMVVMVFYLTNKVIPNKTALTIILNTILAVIMTALFGVLSSVVDTLIGFGADTGWKVVTNQFFTRFATLYARGIPFFLTHIISNAIIFAVAYYPLHKLLSTTKQRMYNSY